MEELHGGVKLNRIIDYDFSVNINPFGCCEAIKEAARRGIDAIEEYPEYNADSLRNELSKVHGIDSENILVTAGASEGFLSICRSKAYKYAIVICPCFYGYEYAVKSSDINLIRLNSISELLRKTDFEDTVVFIANPNNPDGKIIDAENLQAILTHVLQNGTDMVIDESFLPLSSNESESLIGLFQKDAKAMHDMASLYVVRSFTKTFAMPALRLGYIVSTRDNIKEMSNSVPEWNISGIAISAGLEALKHIDELSEVRSFIKSERERLTAELEKMGMKVYPSEANFILFEESDINSNGNVTLQDKLLDKNILIRDCSNYYGLSKGHYRIAVKDAKANDYLIASLKEVLNY